jgi:hypothetical protein
MSETAIPKPDPDGEQTPDWDEEYFDRVSDRLMFNYDLAKDSGIGSQEFDLYGRMHIHNEKHFLHPALSFAHHDLHEHLFADRRSGLSVPDFEVLVEFGHDLADAWIESSEEHYSTDFTFVLVGPSIPDDVDAFVSSFKKRSMLNYGYHGHYEINLVAVAPEPEDIVASRGAGVEEAFRLWEPIEKEEPGLWDLFTRRMQL